MLTAHETIAIDDDTGLLLCTDENGQRVTLLGAREAVEMAKLADRDGHGQLVINPAAFPLRHNGWPDDWAER